PGAGVGDGHRQVEVDVGVDAGGGELEPGDVRFRPALEQHLPGVRHVAGREDACPEGGQVPVGEDDIEQVDELAVVEAPRLDAFEDPRGDPVVQVGEAGDAIVLPSRLLGLGLVLDLLLPLYDVGNRVVRGSGVWLRVRDHRTEV